MFSRGVKLYESYMLSTCFQALIYSTSSNICIEYFHFVRIFSFQIGKNFTDLFIQKKRNLEFCLFIYFRGWSNQDKDNIFYFGLFIFLSATWSSPDSDDIPPKD